MLKQLSGSKSRRTTIRGVLAVGLLFSLAVLVKARRSQAFDLQPSYVGCRVLAAGEGTHLYSHSTVQFDKFRDSEWDSLAGGTAVGNRYTGPTYVQTPLWAWLLRPACTVLSWEIFRYLFISIIVLAMCGLVYIVARCWAPDLFSPVRVAVILLAIAIGRPFREVLAFGQTHAIFMVITVLAILLARRNNQIAAGILLACAAAVKITPGYLLLYWLVCRKWKAAGCFVLSSTLIVVLSVTATSYGLFRDFIANLSYTSNILLISYNNQSLAAWWEGMHMAPELQKWIVHPLPLGMKILSLLLTLASSFGGGWLDLKRADDQPPYGAIFALLGATVFASISWNHYAIILIIPIMLLVQHYVTERRSIWLVLAAAIYVLNLDPGIGIGKHIVFPIVRSHFFAMVLSMAAMVVCVLMRQTAGERPPSRFR